MFGLNSMVVWMDATSFSSLSWNTLFP